ncbi:chaperone SurA [Rhodoferax lithotrophicus]|uniref:Chaperone SurA n=1 Tax=Rhodoferax lithotrophicus TaxID=2798804 RepID=A0ABM7MPR5_9BURK|nr:peptidylprolyl isomerase [Rhodoferax sp. MIZ03]BCO28336.1 chaperone SurA [Rhodoferax sp. MIZ03]
MRAKKWFSTAIFVSITLSTIFSALGVQAYEVTETDVRESYNFSVAIAEKTVFEVSHILVSDQKTASGLSGRLVDGESWDSLAENYSTDPGSRSKGGRLGWHFSRDFVEPFAKAVRGLKPGTVSRPVQTPFGWHLIKVLRTRPYVPASFDSVRAKQEEMLKKQIASIESKGGDKALLNNDISKAALSAPVLRRLIELGADVNSTGASGSSPLALACTLGLVTEAQTLITAGAAVDVPDRGSQTPLHLAALSDKTGAIAALLLQKGATVGREDSSGIAPIHFAAMADNSETIRVLLKAGEFPDHLSSEKMTPLMYAGSTSSPRAISALLDSGADPLAVWTDPQSKVPLQKTALDMSLLSSGNTPKSEQSLEMLRKAASTEALKRSRNSFRAFISQDNQRVEVGKGPILLKKKPFAITFEAVGAPRVAAVAIDLGETTRNTAAVLDRLQPQMRSAMRAMAEEPRDSTLFVFSGDDPEPGFQSWGNNDERPDFASYKQTATGYVATRQINSLDEIPVGDVSPSSPGPVTHKLGQANSLKPMLLVLFIPESLGVFEYAVKQLVSGEIRWVAP